MLISFRQFCWWLRSLSDKVHFQLQNELKLHDGRHGGALVSHDSILADEMGESSIISNILSMDFDLWDEALPSPQNLVKLPGETDKQFGPLGAMNMKKVQNSNQSRFSFAREEHQASNFGPSSAGCKLLGIILSQRF